MVIVHIAMLNYQRVSHELPIRSMFHPRNGQKWDDYVGETVFFSPTQHGEFRVFPLTGCMVRA